MVITVASVTAPEAPEVETMPEGVMVYVDTENKTISTDLDDGADVYDEAIGIEIALTEAGYSGIEITINDTGDAIESVTVTVGSIKVPFELNPDVAETDGTKVAVDSEGLVAAIEAGASTIKLGSGEYTIGPVISSDVEIIGNGDTEIKTADTNGETAGVYVSGSADVVIKDVTFTAGGTGAKRGILVPAGFTGSVEITGCEFVGLNTGVYLNDVGTAVIENNIFDNCVVGVSFDNVNENPDASVTIADNTFNEVDELVGAQKEAYGYIDADVTVVYYNGADLWTPSEEDGQ